MTTPGANTLLKRWSHIKCRARYTFTCGSVVTGDGTTGVAYDTAVSLGGNHYNVRALKQLLSGKLERELAFQRCVVKLGPVTCDWETPATKSEWENSASTTITPVEE